jgi:ribosomal protein S18
MISRSIKNVTVAGVSLSNSKYVHLSNCLQITGAIGPSIIHSLNTAGFQVQALTRRRQTTSIPNKVNIVEVDYNDSNTLRRALRDQDAVVSCLGDVPAAVQAQDSLLDASLAVGVKRFVPSEFGSDTTNQHVRSYPFFKAKVEHQRRLRQAARTCRDFSYSFLITGPFIDWGLSKVPFIINVGARTAEGIVPSITACWRSPVGDCTAQLTQLHHSHRRR